MFRIQIMHCMSMASSSNYTHFLIKYSPREKHLQLKIDISCLTNDVKGKLDFITYHQIIYS